VIDTVAKLFVIAAPSGAGKTTLVKALTTRNPELRFSISYTTRPQRRTEAHGVDYLFVDKPQFDKLRADGALLESAEVFDNFYGTSREQVEKHLGQGRHVILEIDWQGAQPNSTTSSSTTISTRPSPTSKPSSTVSATRATRKMRPSAQP
jgi:guanylate kinase